MQQDEYFLRYQVIDYLLSVAQVNNGYAFSELIQEAYFKEDELGDFTKMSRGFVDVSVILKSIKVYQIPFSSL